MSEIAYPPDDIVDAIAVYDCSDGGHSDKAGASALDLLSSARSEIIELRKQVFAISAPGRTEEAGKLTDEVLKNAADGRIHHSIIDLKKSWEHNARGLLVAMATELIALRAQPVATDWREILMTVAECLELPRSTESGPPDDPLVYERAIDGLEADAAQEHEHRKRLEKALAAQPVAATSLQIPQTSPVDGEVQRYRDGIKALHKVWFCEGADLDKNAVAAQCLKLFALLPPPAPAQGGDAAHEQSASDA